MVGVERRFELIKLNLWMFQAVMLFTWRTHLANLFILLLLEVGRDILPFWRISKKGIHSQWILRGDRWAWSWYV